MHSAETQTASLPQVFLASETSFVIDYSLGDFDEDIQAAIDDFLNAHVDRISTHERKYTVTVQYEDQNHIQHIRLVPTVVYESNWTLPLVESDIISLYLIGQEVNGVKSIEFESQTESLSFPQQVNASYSFPWTGGQDWAKTQGFHYNNLGYSLDFAPRNGASNNVLAIESGVFSPYCYIAADPYQAMVVVSHSNGDKSGYLHLDKASIPSSLFNQSIPKGRIIGSLYTGSAIDNPASACTDITNYKFATACGCGYGTHLHFETNNLITIQGYSLSSISSSANGTIYTSDNSSSLSCCGCSTQSPVYDTPFLIDSDLLHFPSIHPGSLVGMEIEDTPPMWLEDLIPTYIITSTSAPVSLTWPAAIDEVGRVVGYYVYWGNNPEGTDDFVIADNSFDVPDGAYAQGSSYYLRVAAVDDQDNISEWHTVSVLTYDFDSPTGTLEIAGGGDTASVLNIPLALEANDTTSRVAEMRFSSDGKMWTEWESYRESRRWQLSNVDSLQTVYAQVRDEAGNVSEVISATITADLNTQPPSSTTYTVACSVFGMGGGTKASTSYTVHSTTGQPYGTGVLQSSSYRVHTGFWGGCGDIALSPELTHYVFLPLVLR
jgi:hypothetical protein